MRKVTRILAKVLLYFTASLIFIAAFFYFAIQSHNFQTWAGKVASDYLSEELHSNLSIDRIEIDFFKTVHLKSVFVKDLHNDTLVYAGDLSLDIRKFDNENQVIDIKNVLLQNAIVKIKKYKGEKDFNFQFLADYFSSDSKSSDSSEISWQITHNHFTLDNVNFIYDLADKPKSEKGLIDYDHLNISRLSGNISDLNFKGDTIGAIVSNLKLKELSGFELYNLSSNIKFSPAGLVCRQLILITPGTYLAGRLEFVHDSLEAYNNFIEQVNMKVDLHQKTQVYLPDIAFFTNEVKGLDDTIHISGKIRGPLSDLNLQYLTFRLKDYTEFVGDISVVGLPDLDFCYLHLDAKKLNTHYNDLASIPNYPFYKNEKLPIPIEIKRLGKISYTGKFDGLLNDFNFYGNLRTEQGGVTTDLAIRTGKSADDLEYDGQIKLEKLQLGNILNIGDFNHLKANIKLKGKGVSVAKIKAKMEGNITSLSYNKYVYNNIKIDGDFKDKTFTGLLVSSDPNADFDFNGSIHFTKKMPDFDFISTVNNLNLKALNFTKDEASVSTQILITLNGDNVNNLTGNINFDNTKYSIKDKKYKISTFDLHLNQETENKSIHLSSNYFNLDVDGLFKITNLPMAFRQTLHDYYPAFVKWNPKNKKYTDAFTFKIKVKKFNTIQELFVNALSISPNTTILGDFDASRTLLNFNLSSELVELGSLKFHDNKIESYSKDHKINLVFKGKDIQLTDSVKLDNYFMYLVSKDYETKFNLEWNDKVEPNSSGKIFGKLHFNEAKAQIDLETINIKTKDSLWSMTQKNPIFIDSSGAIVVHPLKFVNGQQEINLSGNLSKKSNDSINFVSKALYLDQFNPFLKPYGLKLSGYMNGAISAKNLDNQLIVNSALEFSAFKFNDNLLGELILKSDYITKEKRIDLEGYSTLGLRDFVGNQIKNFSFGGKYYLDKPKESIDISFKANPLNLRIANPFLEGILTIEKGFVNGKGRVHGEPDNILLEGELTLFNSEIKVDYTNVTYDMSGKIEIMPDQIRFSDLLMKDPYVANAVPQGTINGNIFHRKFKNMQLDYDVTFKDMLVLNTQEKDNPDFFGNIIASGNVGLWGFLNDIHTQVRATPTKKSEFILPLDGPEEVAENDYITFVKKDTVEKEIEKDFSGFNLDLKFQATDKLLAKIIFDRTNNDLIQVFGNGEISMNINTLGKFEMFGDYIIDGGEYDFSLEKVISKKFEIDGGSTISWSGDPLNAEIDITASYRQRASIAPLINDATGAYKGRTAAACKLKMKDKLMNPNISFELAFPSISDNVRSQIVNVLADEQELNRQVFSFLIFRSFVPPLIYNSTGGGVTAGNAAASTGSELLSNRLSSMLDGMVGNFAKDLQLGVNYRPGSESSSDEVLMNVNKTYMDDKLSIDGNFGMGSGNSGNRNFIGDVNIEYKLSDDGRYKLKGFNRTNDNTQLITSGGLYTQGIGFFFREEFDSFDELYKRYLEKIKGNKKP
ncbi:MAG: translocation/assembly module TamB domain-containing protein [Bacteroidia bacterium]